MAEHARLLIRGGHLLTMDDDIGEVPDGDILIEDGRIAYVGPSADADGAEIIDASDCIVIPGLVDTHNHLWQTLVRGAAADVFAGEYQTSVKRLRANYEPADKRLAAFVGALEAISGGCTTVLDHYHDVPDWEHAEAALSGIRESRLRVVFAPSMNPPREGVASTHANRLDLVGRIADAVRADDNDGLVYPALAHSDPQFIAAAGDRWHWISDEAEYARERGIRRTFHCVLPNHLGRYYELGALGPELVPTHSDTLTDEEYRYAREAGMSVNVTPVADFRKGSTYHVRNAKRNGVNVSFGIDSTVFGAGDLLGQLRLAYETVLAEASQLESRESRPRERRSAYPTHSPLDILRQGSMGGAIALGLQDRIGSLTVGKDADVVVCRPNRFSPSRSHPATQILTDHASTVDTVILRGDVRKRDGRLVGFDVDELFGDAKSAVDRIFGTPLPGVPRRWWSPPAEAEHWDTVSAMSETVSGIDVGSAGDER
jgi:5-methylthioadenosine/S-adenosylhomocysteine deaminase